MTFPFSKDSSGPLQFLPSQNNVTLYYTEMGQAQACCPLDRPQANRLAVPFLA